MNSETKQCQNCKKDFIIEPEDFDFYAKIQVPPPTFCPQCRVQRRFAWRNERTLHRRSCSLCSKSMISMYPADTAFPVYCHTCWYSDGWDSMSYGREYDFSKPFFAQYQDLLNVVPRFSLFQRESVNSDYANFAAEAKNVYLSYSAVNSEDVYYSRAVDDSRNVFDCLNVSSLESCYGGLYYGSSNKAHFLLRSQGCINAWLLFDSINCQDCILSHNLRNKRYVIRNVQYSKEEYAEQLKQFDFGSHVKLEEYKKEFVDMVSKSIHRYADIFQSTGSTGDAISQSKDSQNCFEGWNLDNVHNLVRGYRLKDSYDIDFVTDAERLYEYICGGKVMDNVRCSTSAISNLNDVSYTDSCGGSANLFGCISLRSKKFCILNKQYTEEEYCILVSKIIEHMNAMPYSGKNGRMYVYGDFFPIELSPFAYNETVAQEYFPLTKQEVEEHGFRWRDAEKKEYAVTLSGDAIPDHIRDVQDTILSEVIGCDHAGGCNEQCTSAFKIIPQELEFYRRMSIPIPHLCPNCRHYERLKLRNPLKLWECTCMCSEATSTPHHHVSAPCSNTFRTNYPPDSEYIVYCEQCYQAEIV
jgi:hypothetical protein